MENNEDHMKFTVEMTNYVTGPGINGGEGGALPRDLKIEVGGSWLDFGNFLVGVGNLDFC